MEEPPTTVTMDGQTYDPSEEDLFIASLLVLTGLSAAILNGLCGVAIIRRRLHKEETATSS